MRYASAKNLKMKATDNIKLPNQTNDVMVNPINLVNPDSKPDVSGQKLNNHNVQTNVIR